MTDQPTAVSPMPSGFAMRMHRDEALAWGHAEPTTEEIAAARDRIPAQYAEQVTAWSETTEFLRQLAAADLPPLVRGVLNMHSRANDRLYAACTECSGCCESHAEWPCDTARLLITDAGIDVPDELVFETPVLPIPDPDNPRWPFPAGPVTWGSLFPRVTVSRAPLNFDFGEKRLP